ncbi:MAG: peroxiredoxin family protein [Opitutales bacterium]
MACLGAFADAGDQASESEAALENAYDTFRKASLARRVYPVRALARAAREAGDAEALEQYTELEVSEYAQHRAELTDFALSVLKDTTALAVSASRWSDYRLDDLAAAVQAFQAKFPEHEDLPVLLDKIESLKRVRVGATAPAITGNSPSGETLSLAEFKGKYVLLDFWAGWCPPCRVENANYVELYSEYGGDEFEILAISQDRRPDQWKRAIAQDKATWKHISDVKGMDSSQAKAYAVTALPASFLIDPDGIIIAKDLRGDALAEKLAEVLK